MLRSQWRHVMALGWTMSLACRGDGREALAGRVVDADLRPLAGITVRVGNSTATTDTRGEFQVVRPAGSYDAVLDDGTRIVVYLGLTRTDPTLTVPQHGGIGPGGRSYQAAIHGALSGGPTLGSTLTAGAVNVTYDSPDASAFGGASSGESVYSIDRVAWQGDASTTTGRVRAIQGAFAGDWPCRAFAYGERAGVTLVDGASAQADVALVPIEAGAIGMSLSSATGNPVQADVHAIWADGGVLPVNWIGAVSGDVSLPVPRLAGPTFRVFAFDPGFGGVIATGVAADAAGLALRVPSAPAVSTPTPGAELVGSTDPLAWTGEHGGVYHVVLAPACGKRVEVITASERFTLASLRADGVVIAGATKVTWSVSRYEPLASVDDAAGRDGLAPWSGALVVRPGVAAWSGSPAATFTTGEGPACPPSSGGGIAGAVPPSP